MRGLVVAFVVVVAGLVGGTPVFDEVRVAPACSCPDCDAVRDAELIVGGRIVSWWSVDSPLPDKSSQPIQLDFRVDVVYKGIAPPNLQLHDSGSLSSYLVNGKLMWLAGSGGCQAFSADPTDKYVIFGLSTTGPDAYHPFGPQVFFIGDQLSGELFESARARLSSLGAPHPPSVGDSPPAESPSFDDSMFLPPVGTGFMLLAVVLLLVGLRKDKQR